MASGISKNPPIGGFFINEQSAKRNVISLRIERGEVSAQHSEDGWMRMQTG